MLWRGGGGGDANAYMVELVDGAAVAKKLAEMVGERLVEMNIAAKDINASNARPTKEEIDRASRAVIGSPLPPKDEEECHAYLCSGGMGHRNMVQRLRGQKIVPTCLEGGLCAEVRVCDTTHARTRSPRACFSRAPTHTTTHVSVSMFVVGERGGGDASAYTAGLVDGA